MKIVIRIYTELVDGKFKRKLEAINESKEAINKNIEAQLVFLVYHIMGKQTKYNKKMKGQSMDICYYFSYGTKNKQVFIKEGVPKVYTLPIYIFFFSAL